jgi:hypothetical protein
MRPETGSILPGNTVIDVENVFLEPDVDMVHGVIYDAAVFIGSIRTS